nr:hypothetical protein BgiMline_032809 [Biomphalaria glabrata]
MHCAPGSNFDEDLGNCVAMNDVKCNGRPSKDSSGIQSVSTRQTNIQFPNTNLGKSVTLRLNSRQNGPLLRSDQCAEIGRQLTRYLKTLVSTYEPSCTVNSACQQNLPFFKVECQTSTGRVIV